MSGDAGERPVLLIGGKYAVGWQVAWEMGFLSREDLTDEQRAQVDAWEERSARWREQAAAVEAERRVAVLEHEAGEGHAWLLKVTAGSQEDTDVELACAGCPAEKVDLVPSVWGEEDDIEGVVPVAVAVEGRTIRLLGR